MVEEQESFTRKISFVQASNSRTTFYITFQPVLYNCKNNDTKKKQSQFFESANKIQ